MTNRRSTQFALALATLSVAATAVAVPLAHVAAAPAARPAVVGTVGDSTEGAPVARSTRIAAAPAALPAASGRVVAASVASRQLAGPVAAVRFAVSPLLVPDIPTGHDPLATVALDAVAAFRSFIHHPSISNLSRYIHQRNGVATQAAHRLGLSPAAMQHAWNSADTAHQIALLSAFTQLGVPYRHISRRPGVGFDCSGLTSWAWDQVGVNMSHVANAQIRNIKNVNHLAAEAGDIAYFPGHAMMYLGISTAIIHSPYTGRTVEIDVLNYHTSSTRYGDPLPSL